MGAWERIGKSNCRRSVIQRRGSGTAYGLWPVGPRFGSLVHAVLERVALTAGADAVSDLVMQQGRVFGATDEECLACEVAVVRALEPSVMDRPI